MRTIHGFLTAALIACAGLAIACDDDDDDLVGPAPHEGSLRVMYTTPAASDGAVLLTIAGGDVNRPTAASSNHYLAYRILDTRTMKVAIAGNLTSGALLTFEVSDVGNAADYEVTIEQVATQANGLVAGAEGYSATVQVVN